MKWGLAWQVGLFALAFILGSCAILGVIHHHRRQHFESLFAQQAEDEKERLRSQIEVNGRSLRNFCYDYSYWDELVAFVSRPSRKWADENLHAPMDSFRIDGV